MSSAALEKDTSVWPFARNESGTSVGCKRTLISKRSNPGWRSLLSCPLLMINPLLCYQMASVSTEHTRCSSLDGLTLSDYVNSKLYREKPLDFLENLNKGSQSFLSQMLTLSLRFVWTSSDIEIVSLRTY